jgi:hypothetical protein
METVAVAPTICCCGFSWFAGSSVHQASCYLTYGDSCWFWALNRGSSIFPAGIKIASQNVQSKNSTYVVKWIPNNVLTAQRYSQSIYQYYQSYFALELQEPEVVDLIVSPMVLSASMHVLITFGVYTSPT